MDDHTRRVIRWVLTEGLPIAARVANYVTRAAAVTTEEQLRDADQVVQAAKGACAGYHAGFLEGLGLPGSGGDPEWRRIGFADGTAALEAQVDRLVHDSRFVARTGKEEADAEVIEVVRELLRDHAADIDRALGEIADKEIKTLYMRLWREGAGRGQDEAPLRARLGLSLAGFVDTLPL